MPSPPAPRPRSAVPPVVLVGIFISLSAAAIAWRWGAAREGFFDSAFYLDGARHLARGEGYVSALTAPEHSSADPVTHWAPGLPLMIAGVIRLGVPPLEAAAWVLALCYVAAVTLTYALGIRLAGPHHWAGSALVSLVFALQPSTLRWMNALLSDLPDATFMLLAVWFAAGVMHAERPSLGQRAALGLALAALATIRYAGMLHVPGLLIATMLGMRERKRWYARAWSLWPAVALCALSVGLWSFRNHRVVSEPFGVWIMQRSEMSRHFVRALRGAFAWLHELDKAAEPLGLHTVTQRALWAAGLCLVPLLLASGVWAWRELGLVALPVLSYFGLMIVTASTLAIATLAETRLWVSVWPLTFLGVLIALAHAQPRWLLPFKAVVYAALLGALALFAAEAWRKAPPYQQGRGLLSEAWARAAAELPAPTECRLFVMDPRPFMLHRELGPTSQLPLSLAEFDAAAAHHGNLCVVTTDKRMRLSTTAEKRRIDQDAVVAALTAQQRLERIVHADGVSVYRVKGWAAH